MRGGTLAHLLLLLFSLVGAAVSQVAQEENSADTSAPAAVADATKAEAPAGTYPDAIELTVEGLGSVSCTSRQEPADVVLAFAREAAAAGVTMTAESITRFYDYFCGKRKCSKELVTDIIELKTDAGVLTCAPWQEPADVVEEFGQELSKGGARVNVQAMNQMMQYFCERMVCFRNIARPIKLEISGVGALVVNAWQDPADAVEQFAMQAIAAKIPIDGDGMKQMMEYFCARRKCKRMQITAPNLPQPIELEVEGVGKVVVGSLDDPADAVERFAREAVGAGLPVKGEDMKKMMEYFCARRPCERYNITVPPPQEPITLTLDGIGKLTVRPNQDPADAVEQFTAAAIAQGAQIDGNGMVQMMQYFCARRSCRRMSLNPPVGPLKVAIEGVGEVTCPPNAEPADVVEAFAQQAVEAGLAPEAVGGTMKQMLEYFCARRKCNRFELRMPAMAQPIKLEIQGVGTMTCGPNQDPADVVEAFAKQAIEAGFPVDGNGMQKMMEYFCARKKCNRMQLNMPAAAQPIKLDVDGIGSVTCGPSQDPADVVEEFTRQAMEAGVPMTGEAMQQMMEYFCARKKCKRMQVNMPQGGGAQGLGGGLPSGGGLPTYAAPASSENVYQGREEEVFDLDADGDMDLSGETLDLGGELVDEPLDLSDFE
jgi:hypothetical protein